MAEAGANEKPRDQSLQSGSATAASCSSFVTTVSAAAGIRSPRFTKQCSSDPLANMRPIQTTPQLNRLGKVKLILGGRCIIGPDLRLASAAFAMIIVPMIIWDGWSLPWMWRRWHSAWVLILVSIIVEIMVLIFFIRTAISDPGVVPRQAEILCQDDKAWHLQITPQNPPKHQDVVIHGHLFKMKYCASCCYYRPPRCVHCSVCDNCVDKFDHHCPWVGNCVGRRNYRTFLFFLFSTSLFILLVLGASPVKFVQCLQDEGPTFRTSIQTVWSSAWDAAILTLYSFGLLWFVLGLAGYHSYLLMSNQTTYEQIKGYFDEKLNPWDRGLLRNLRELLCQRRRPRFSLQRPDAQPLLYRELSAMQIAATGRVQSGGTMRFRLPPPSATKHPSLEMKLSKSAISIAQAPTTGGTREGWTAPSQATLVSSHSLLPGDDEAYVTPYPIVSATAVHSAAPPESARESALNSPEASAWTTSGAGIIRNTTMTNMDEDSPVAERLRSAFRVVGRLGRYISSTRFGQWTCVLPTNEGT